jgi:hypothetical protein
MCVYAFTAVVLYTSDVVLTTPALYTILGHSPSAALSLARFRFNLRDMLHMLLSSLPLPAVLWLAALATVLVLLLLLLLLLLLTLLLAALLLQWLAVLLLVA